MFQLKREYKACYLVKPYFAKFKKHKCTNCGGELKLFKITQMISPETPEAVGKPLYFGLSKKPISYSFFAFECCKCENKLSIYDQFFIENPNKLEKYNRKYGDYKLKDDYHSYLRLIKKDENS